MQVRNPRGDSAVVHGLTAPAGKETSAARPQSPGYQVASLLKPAAQKRARHSLAHPPPHGLGDCVIYSPSLPFLRPYWVSQSDAARSGWHDNSRFRIHQSNPGRKLTLSPLRIFETKGKRRICVTAHLSLFPRPVHDRKSNRPWQRP